MGEVLGDGLVRIGHLDGRREVVGQEVLPGEAREEAVPAFSCLDAVEERIPVVRYWAEKDPTVEGRAGRRFLTAPKPLRPLPRRAEGTKPSIFMA